MQAEKAPGERAEDLIRLLVSDWRPSSRQVVWTIRFVFVLGVLVAIGYVYGITLWDWMKLLVVPLEDRRGSLKDELRRLAKLPPSSGAGEGHPSDVQIECYAEAAGVVHERRLELEDLKKQITEALDACVDPVIKSHVDQKARVEALSRDRSWEQSPVGSGGTRI